MQRRWVIRLHQVLLVPAILGALYGLPQAYMVARRYNCVDFAYEVSRGLEALKIGYVVKYGCTGQGAHCWLEVVLPGNHRLTIDRGIQLAPMDRWDTITTVSKEQLLAWTADR